MSLHNHSPLAFLSIPPLVIVVALVVAALVGAIVYGVCRWRQPRGKAIAIVAGLLLLLLLAAAAVAVVCILITVQSGSMG